MTRFLIAALLAALPLPAAAQPAAAPSLSLEQRMLLRCSAAFALVAGDQQRGLASAYPPLAERGREFFVRASARLMDEAGLDREGIAALLTVEARSLREGEALAQVMPACLAALDGAGL